MSKHKGTSRKKRETLAPKFCEYPACSYRKIVQRHRIIPGRDGGKYVLGNVIALCPNHHGEADRGWIPVEFLLAIVRKRIEEDGSEPEDTHEGTERTPFPWADAPTESPEGARQRKIDGANGDHAGGVAA
jgi:hypothetical protein